MRFVFLNQYYPPDVAPTGVMLEAVARELERRGHAVTVICADGGYGNARGQSHGSPSVPGGSSFAPEQAKGLPEAPAASEGGGSGRGSGRGVGAGGAGAGLEIRRVRALAMGRGSFVGKILDYLSYYGGVAWRMGILQPRAEVMVALTTPPFLSLLARVGAWRSGGRHAHWVMDLYPDVMTAHGMLRAGSWGERLLGALARWGMGGKRCTAVLTLGPDMAERVGRYVPDDVAVQWVPLWGTAGEEPSVDTVAALRARRGWDGAVVFLYSGNMGLGHLFPDVLEAGRRLLEEKSDGGAACGPSVPDGSPIKLESVVQAAAGEAAEVIISRTRDENDDDEERNTGLRMAFFGGGKRKAEVAEVVAAAGDSRLEVHDYVAREDLAAHLASGDVHLASLDPKWDGMMVPSKLQGIFAAGRPVLFTGSRECSIGRWILESGGGWVVAPGDVDGHVAAMREALDLAERERRGAAAREFAGRCFDAAVNVRVIADLLEGEGFRVQVSGCRS